MFSRKKTPAIEHLFGQLIDALPGNVYLLNKDMLIIDCNEQQARFFGYASGKDIVGKSLYDILNENDASAIIENNKKVLKNVKTLEFQETIHRNNQEFSFLSRKKPLYDNKNNIIGILGVSFNITELKDQERNREIVLEKLIAYMPGHVYWQNKEGVILGCNDKQAQSFGFTSNKDILGKTPYDLLPKEQADAITKINMEVMEKGGINAIEEKLTFGYGDAYVLSQKLPLYDNNNKAIGILGVSFDITKQKQTEKALAEQVEKTKQAYASKSSFISISTHEVIGPVSNSISMTDMTIENLKEIQSLLTQLPEKNANAKTIQLINQKINEATDNLIINSNESYRAINGLKNMLEINRLQTEGIAVNFEYANITSLIDGAIKNNAYSDKHNIQFNIKLSKSAPTEVKIDYSNISDALKIIIGNAIKYSDADGAVDIIIEHSKNNLLINVQDHGIGMKAGQIENLPNTFFNTDATQTRNYIKPSILLSQAKMKVEASGGSIKIDSKENVGTIVTLQTPFQPFSSAKTVKSIKNQPLPAITAKPVQQLKFLLIEDDALTQKNHKTILERLGHKVDSVASGADAIRLGQTNQYDIIWLDITLPDIDGLKVMHTIKKLLNKQTPFVAVTSYSSQQDYEEFLKQGVITVLTKPIKKAEFADCIQSILSANEDEDS